METQTIAAAVYHRLLRRLDYCPAWLALPVGIGVGVLGAAAVLTWTPAVVGAALFVLLLGGAARLAWSCEPVARLVEVHTGTKSAWSRDGPHTWRGVPHGQPGGRSRPV